jgi:hypothetical protein
MQFKFRRSVMAQYLPLSAPAKRLQYETHIKTFDQKIMTTYRLPIEIEHALPNWFLVEEGIFTTIWHYL